jgi:hypothetical protein
MAHVLFKHYKPSAAETAHGLKDKEKLNGEVHT